MTPSRRRSRIEIFPGAFTDGIYIDSSRDVRISDSYLDNGGGAYHAQGRKRRRHQPNPDQCGSEIKMRSPHYFAPSFYRELWTTGRTFDFPYVLPAS